MTIKYYTLQSPPPVLAEPVSELPDECRQSDYIPLSNLLERFLSSGARLTQYLGSQSLSAEEKEKMFEQVDVDDLAEADLSEQKAFMDSVNDVLLTSVKTVEQKPTQVEEPAPEKQPETAKNA